MEDNLGTPDENCDKMEASNEVATPEVPAELAKTEKVQSSHGGDEDLDSLLIPLGGFGKFQMLNLFYLCFLVILCACSELGFVFTSAELKHRCLISECETEQSSYKEPWLPSAIPTLAGGGFDSCRRFTNDTGLICQNTTVSTQTFNCKDFIYETDEWSIAREDWGVKCDDEKWRLTLIGSLNNAGQMVGCFYVGFLADRFGRKFVLIGYGLAVAAFGAIKSFSVNYVMMAIFEFLEASMACFLFNGPFVLAMEIVDPSKRVLAGMILSSAYALGEVILGGVQSLTFEWRTTLRIIYVPFVLLIIYFWLLPESLRWLINNNRHDDAFEILKKIAKTNGKQVTTEMEKKLYSIQTEEKGGEESKWKSLAETWKSKIMRTRTIVCLYIWMVVTFVFFGMSMTSVSISDDKFTNFILSALIEVPSYVAVYFTLDRLGRRLILSVFLIVCGVGCGISAYIPDGESWAWAKLVLYLVGKFGASVAFMALDVYTTELFPTSLRSTAMGLGLMIGKLATIVAPQMPLLADLYKPLPLLIFSILSLVAGSAAMYFLPETLNLKLPDTVEEAESLGKKTKQSKDGNV